MWCELRPDRHPHDHPYPPPHPSFNYTDDDYLLMDLKRAWEREPADDPVLEASILRVLDSMSLAIELEQQRDLLDVDATQIASTTRSASPEDYEHCDARMTINAVTINTAITNKKDGSYATDLIKTRDCVEEQKQQDGRLSDVCLKWAVGNISHPYPSSSDKEEIAELSECTILQVSNWFTNWRSRRWRGVARDLGVYIEERSRPDRLSAHRRRIANDVLRESCMAWLNESQKNKDHPYPSPKAKRDIAIRLRDVGKDENSVNNWFINYRKRKWTRA